MLDLDAVPCALCHRIGAVKLEVDKDGEVWTLCQFAEDPDTGEERDPEDCHWSARGKESECWPAHYLEADTEPLTPERLEAVCAAVARVVPEGGYVHEEI